MVMAPATSQGRGKKVIVSKYKSKKRYRHRRGHRQELTILTIDDIVAGGKSLITGAAPKAREEELPAVDELETPAPLQSSEAEEATGEAADTEDAEVETARRR